MRKLWSGLILLVILLAIAGFTAAETQLALNTPTTVEIDIRGDVAIYEFTPTVDGIYKFYSSSVNEQEWCYTHGWLFDEDMMLITENEGSEYRYGHFFIQHLLKASKKYYFATSFSPYMAVAGTGTFLIHLDHTDGLFAETTRQTVYSAYGKTGTVDITSYSPNGAVTYQWYDGDSAISGATSSQYTYPALTANKIYKCAVSDGVSTKTVSVNAKISSGLNLGYNYRTDVDYGDSTELTVNANASYGADQLTYQWYENLHDENGEWVTEPIEGATSPRLALNNVTQSASYECAVTDINGETQWSYHYVYVSENFTLTAVGETQIEVANGGSVTLSVSAEAAGPVSYSWYKFNPDYYERIPIPNAEGPSYTITNATVSDEYICEAKSAYGNSSQVSFYVSVTGAFNASADGSTEIVMNPGETAVMKVNASSNVGTLSYQWYYYNPTFSNNIPIKGAVSANYSLSGNAKVGAYECRVADSVGNSKSISFRVSSADVLSVEADSPTNVALAPGDTETLKVAVTSSDENLKIRWYQRKYNTGYRVVIDGARTTSLNIIGGERSDYSCVVTDRYGNTSTVWFYVYVDNGFSVTAETTEFTVLPGESVRLNATGECANGEITYRWSHNDINHRYETVKESNESFLVIDAVNADNCGRYELNAYDEYGNYYYISFNIAVKNNLTAVATNNISEVTVDPGEDVELSVTANCDAGVDRLTYQWYENLRYGDDWHYTEINHETGSTLRLTNVQEAKDYRCMVSDEFGNSVQVNFRVRIDNELTANPFNGDNNITVQPGEAATLTVTASCKTGELTYQWYKEYLYEENGYSYWNKEKITGATGASYTTETISQYTEYYCEVEDAYKNSSTVWFYVMVDNDLRADALNYNTSITVESGETATLTVVASCKTGGLIYQWYKHFQYEENGNTYGNSERIQGATGTSYTTEAISQYTQYYCEVKDSYSNSTTVWFGVRIDNGLTVNPVGSRTKQVEVGEDVTLEVTATCNSGEMSYQWYRGVKVQDEHGNSWYEFRDLIPETTGNSYTVQNVGNKEKYRCTVEDAYGGSEDIDFEIKIKNGLNVKSATSNGDFTVPFNETVKLGVYATCNNGGLHYQWYRLYEYEDNGEWSRWSTIIPDATEPFYTTEAVTEKKAQYYCEVLDDYDNSYTIWFYIYAETGLTAEADETFVFTVSDAPITMAVTASNDLGDTEFSYQWYEDYSAVSGATGSSFTVTNPREGTYFCDVSDGSVSQRVWFYIVDGPFAWSYGRNDIYVKYGEQATLQVAAWNEEDDITYEWYERDGDNSDYTLIEGETKSTYTFTVKYKKELYCHVTGTGINTNVGYWVYVDSNWYIDYSGKSRVNVLKENQGVQFTINVIGAADDELTYRWSRNYETIENETSNTIMVTKGGTYYFEAKDQYGKTSGETFYFIEGQPENLKEGVNVTGQENGEVIIYQIIPGKTGTYQVNSESYVEIYCDGAWNSYLGFGYGSTDIRLEAGKTYYVVLDSSYDNFSYSLIKEEQNEFNIALQKGMDLRIPGIDFNGSWCYVDHAISSDQSVVRISDTEMKTIKEGNATVTVYYDNDIQRVFHITVMSGSMMILPDQLTIIDEDAFNGDTSVKFVKLGTSVGTVKSGAFANLGDITVIAEGNNANFEGGVFKNTNPLFICEDNSISWYCRQYGIPYFTYYR